MADSIRVQNLLSEVGKAVIQAQSEIRKQQLETPAPAGGMRTAVSISEAEIEVKMLFAGDGAAATIQPVSAGQSRLNELNPGILSTLRARVVAVPDEEVKPPLRKPSEIADSIRKRADITRLAKIIGDVEVEPQFIPSANKWLVDVRDSSGKVVRSLQVPDEAEK